MATDTYDVVVAGAGPAGSTAALVLARGGARVLLVDPDDSPRDKACGDLVGPRGVQLLDELAVAVPDARTLGVDLVVQAPSGRSLDLPWPAARRLPGHVLSVPRARFDAVLRDAALAAGARPERARVHDVSDGAVRLSTGATVRAGAVVGADGPMSRVAASAGLTHRARPLWGLAIRAYADAEPPAPVIAFNPPGVVACGAPPGYGWIFPGPEGRANVGVGVAVGAQRDRATGVKAMLDAYVGVLEREGRMAPGAREPGSRRGGWLRMGMAGVVPARDRVLLCGDAAALVNPLQGEGIAEAMLSGRDAADALLSAQPDPAGRYRHALAARHARFHGAAAAIQRAFIRRPGALAGVAGALTAPPIGPAIARGWAIWWNDLLHDAPRGRARAAASTIAALADGLTAADAERRTLREALA